MAKRVIQIVKIVDDLSGEELAEEDGRTVRFGMGSRWYEIDLAHKRAEELENLLHPYIKAGRVVGARRGPDRKTRLTRREVQAVETWAKANGYTDHDIRTPSGKLRKAVLAAYADGAGS